ncbi:MAG TPA: hypothetical protein VEZ90_13475 [Blastocatellia bacterium]|nr:hypothetical protein [Blastocatellia bacterium]
MKFRVTPLVIAAAAAITIAWPAMALGQEYSYTVREDRAVGHRDGQLIISDRGVEFKAKNPKDSASWAFLDIKLFEILSPSKIRIRTYESRSFPPGKEVKLTFQVVGSAITPAVRDFIRERISRPLVTALSKEPQDLEVEVEVEHLHRFGGCQGVLRVYRDFLVFQAAKGSDSRSWRWTDIRSVSKLGKYRLEVLTYEPQTGGPTRSYNFELKEHLSEALYEELWNRVYSPEMPSKKAETVSER